MLPNSLPTADLAVLLVYLVGIAAFGAWFLRTSRSAGEFMAAGGDLPGWAVGLSIFGTYLSSNTFLGVPGKAYGGDWNAFVFSLSIPLAAYFAGRYFVPFYRRSGEVSAYTHLERRFGSWARTYAVVCYLLTQVARMGTVMFGTALGLHALTGWSLPTIIVVTGLVVTLYTLLGGIRAVVWTDVVQSIILMVGAVTVLSLLLAGMPGGPRQAVTIAAEHGKFNLGGFGGGVGQSTFWVVLLYGIFTNLNNFGIDQNYIQRYIVASSDRAAVRSVWVGALLYVPVSLIFFFIGSSLFSYYRVHDGQLEALRSPATAASLSAADSSGPADADIADRVLPHFIVHKLRYGLAGLVIAAIFAAAMSTIDTSLNSSATVFLCDIWRRHVSPDISEAGAMRVLYAFTFMWGLVGTSAALAMIGVKSLLDTWWQISGMIAGAMLGLFLLGVLCKRAGPASAGIGVIAGLAAIAWAKMSPNSNLPPGLRSPLHPNLVIVVGTLTILSVGFVASRIVDRNTLRDLRKRPAMEAPASRSVPS